ncbi:probable L-type lectin-domain containing receptor kinase S.5 [Populus nigra]|uniref:probable L-type lectin-domain containing receptor kinase S.5 n=1 Tax=Populus nigra TaxID=3691 RepID=UPI002B273F17|nr:probable L-type lectin-domain containing receptor kinase S.5 [Populus nigra]
MDLQASVVTIVSFLILALSQAQNLQPFHQEYGPFNETYYDIFQVERPATISNDALQITPDSSNGNFNLANRSGRVLLNKSFILWEDDGAGGVRVASFNSSFVINIFRLNNSTPGEGLAFLIAPDLALPENSDGQYLGLTNSTTDRNPENGIVAIELDTVKQEFDPDDNHMGLNIHSVISLKTVSLDDLGIEIAPVGARNHMVWVHYDGNSKKMEVYMAEEGKAKPATPALAAELNLKDLVREKSYFGFAASTGRNFQLNCVLKWNLTVEMLSDDSVENGGNDNKKLIKICVGIGVGLFSLLLIGVGTWLYYLHKKKAASDPNLLGALKSLPGTPREFPFKDLKKATNNFDERHKLGQGGFGVVYKGLLTKENIQIAVKKFSRENIKGQDDFLSELTIINRLRHKHLVRLLGWCHRNGMLLLVYDYMPNGSLDNHLFHELEGNVILEWNLRYKIISGVASALHYLHNEYDQTVVHRDLKASNIMLDSEFNARLGDFGLARALENEKTSYAELEGVPGTMGYIAPECFHTGKATRESDVYGFGAVVLEVVCGQRPWTKIGGFQFFVDWVWSLHREERILEAVDERLNSDYVAEEAKRLLLLGLACSHPIASERPKTQAIFQIISGSVPPPHVPPFKPAFVWPAAVGNIDVDASSADTIPITSGWTPQYISRESFGTGE